MGWGCGEWEEVTYRRNKGSSNTHHHLHDDVGERVAIATLLSMAVPPHKILAHGDGVVRITTDMRLCVERGTSINHTKTKA